MNLGKLRESIKYVLVRYGYRNKSQRKTKRLDYKIEASLDRYTKIKDLKYRAKFRKKLYAQVDAIKKFDLGGTRGEEKRLFNHTTRSNISKLFRTAPKHGGLGFTLMRTYNVSKTDTKDLRRWVWHWNTISEVV